MQQLNFFDIILFLWWCHFKLISLNCFEIIPLFWNHSIVLILFNYFDVVILNRQYSIVHKSFNHFDVIFWYDVILLLWRNSLAVLSLYLIFLIVLDCIHFFLISHFYFFYINLMSWYNSIKSMSSISLQSLYSFYNIGFVLLFCFQFFVLIVFHNVGTILLCNISLFWYSIVFMSFYCFVTIKQLWCHCTSMMF